MSESKAERGSDDVPKTTMTAAEFMSKETPLVSSVVTFCNNLPMSLYADTTVARSPEVVYRGLILSHNRLVAEEYLLNFRRSDADFGVAIGVNNFRLPVAVAAVAHRDLEEEDGGHIALPPYDTLRAPLGPVIRSRRSVRRYSGKSATLEELSTILYHGGGISGSMSVTNVPATASLGPTDRIDLRTAASGGGLYPVDFFVVALRVEGLAAGAYRYLPRHHALRRSGPPDALPPVASLAQFGEIEADRAAFLIGYVYNQFENARKYGDAGLAYAFIEAGAMAAHVHLAGTALGMGTCDVGSFSKGRCERLFDADGLSRHLIHLTVVGK
ncbi:MAG: SagB/ThcOx family dehydrogenase [Verrucomicrobiae bacterium]|nr:SagB/ThcOx family dehydrogenase [Verrucomicrobiae bacterium]